MRTKSLKRKIKLYKVVLNFTLKYLSPTNSFNVYLSQELDGLIWRYQMKIYKVYKKKHKKVSYLRKVA